MGVGAKIEDIEKLALNAFGIHELSKLNSMELSNINLFEYLGFTIGIKYDIQFLINISKRTILGDIILFNNIGGHLYFIINNTLILQL